MRPQRTQGEVLLWMFPSRKDLQELPSPWTLCVQQEGRCHLFHYQFLQCYHEPMLSFQFLSYLWCQPLLHWWKPRVNFVNVKIPSEGFSGTGCSCFLLAGGNSQIHQDSEESFAHHLKACLCSKKHFSHKHTCLQGASFRDSAGKQGHGADIEVLQTFRLFLWMAALTRRYSDRLCSQRLQKQASSTLVFLLDLIFLIQKFTCISSTVTHLL